MHVSGGPNCALNCHTSYQSFEKSSVNGIVQPSSVRKVQSHIIIQGKAHKIRSLSQQ